MKFQAESLYHIYNRGNNRQHIFFNANNYEYFLNKVRLYLLNDCDILNYCLMPNHFHILIYTKSHVKGNEINNSIAIILRSYAQAINRLYTRTGSVFQQKTKAKILDNKRGDYPFICFNYIHQNPVKAKLVQRMEDWEFSSFRDFIEERDNSFVNRELAKQLLNLPADKDGFRKLSHTVINDAHINGLYQ